MCIQSFLSLFSRSTKRTTNKDASHVYYNTADSTKDDTIRSTQRQHVSTSLDTKTDLTPTYEEIGDTVSTQRIKSAENKSRDTYEKLTDRNLQDLTSESSNQQSVYTDLHTSPSYENVK